MFPAHNHGAQKLGPINLSEAGRAIRCKVAGGHLSFRDGHFLHQQPAVRRYLDECVAALNQRSANQIARLDRTIYRDISAYTLAVFFDGDQFHILSFHGRIGSKVRFCGTLNLNPMPS